MKKRFFRFLMTAFLWAGVSIVFAQEPPPPPGGGHGQSGNQTPGGSAPLGSGIALLLTLAAGYGAKKVYDLRQKLDQ